MRDIIGAKGGGSGGSSGSESPDSLHSIARAKVLDLVSNGEIKGLVNGLQSVFLDGTPIVNPDGSTNFSGYSIDWRWGTQDQDYLPGFPAVENEQAVGVELKSAQPWTHAINDLELSAVRIRIAVPQLQKSNSYRIEYAIDLSTDGGSFLQVLTGAFDGKTTSQYERSIRIELPHATGGWTVRVRRVTPNANSSLIADTTSIQSITEIVDAKLRYPMSAVIGLQIDASQFQFVRAHYQGALKLRSDNA
jgi:predicted phage tail protein